MHLDRQRPATPAEPRSGTLPRHQVQVTSSTATGYVITPRRKSANTFTITKASGTAAIEPHLQHAGKGALPGNGASW